jgi:hypothetical protein
MSAVGGQIECENKRELAMRPIIKITTACGFALAMVCLFSIGQSEPANAQGGIVCSYGTKKYKECCKQSYKEHPKLGARARGNDIDACMDPPKEKKKSDETKPKSS